MQRMRLRRKSTKAVPDGGAAFARFRRLEIQTTQNIPRMSHLGTCESHRKCILLLKYGNICKLKSVRTFSTTNTLSRIWCSI